MFPHRDEARRAGLERQGVLIERGYALLERALARLHGSAAGLETAQLQLGGRDSSAMTRDPTGTEEPRSQGPRVPLRARR